ncbi:MAG: signal recognition particle-docking protein FtsY [archaeon]|nr:signal recognition particle-docking protein FtsY [archaeon]MDA1167776.1 signal recognition particle-docking protein FtsY [archaeon]
MGLFDKFRSKIRQAANEINEDEMLAAEESQEGQEALQVAMDVASDLEQHEDHEDLEDHDDDEEEEWDEIEETPSSSDEQDWDEWDDDDDNPSTPQPKAMMFSKREQKMLSKHQKEQKKAAKQRDRELKKRHATEVSRPKGSRVDLSMMRTATGRQLVEIQQAPKGSGTKTTLTTDKGVSVDIDLGGGIVSEGGKVIKAGAALENLLEELEWILLESDVSNTAVHFILDGLRDQLIGMRLRKGADLSKVLEAALKRALHSLLAAGYWDFDATVQSFIDKGDLPVVIMFVGVNGTGKTTTAAKVAHRLQQQGHSVIAAAGDTFRAGAIQQLETHCERLGIRCISSQRGGDSAAIARDAIDSAKARGIDVVLVDTAGRMQNKTNLMNELEKVRRVANPHLTLFVGDSLAGNDAVEQAMMFQSLLKFDGAILTKMDTDAKGGAGLSIAFATGRPIVFAGIGQNYDDLKQFDPTWLLDQMFE